MREADPHHDAKYTDKDGGQQQFGTFSEEGLKKFEEIRLKITAKRKADGVQMYAFEKEFLEKHIRLESKTAKDAAKKRKSAGDGPGKKRSKIIVVLDESDDEFDVRFVGQSTGSPSNATTTNTTNAAASRVTPRNSRRADDDDDSRTNVDGQDIYKGIDQTEI